MKNSNQRSIPTLKEFYEISKSFVSYLRIFKNERKENDLTSDFKERIMLAVTSVNKCPMCSYHHAKEAIKSGLSQNEIDNLLKGDNIVSNEHQSKAILFAQHYAEQKGNYDKDIYNKIKEIYPKEHKLILGYIKVIMLGNAYGNIADAFFKRLKLSPYKNSSFLHEIGILLGMPIIFVYLMAKYLIFQAKKGEVPK